MVIVELEGNSKDYYHKNSRVKEGNKSKRISIYITLILPDRAINR